jgi:hypothetical protein
MGRTGPSDRYGVLLIRTLHIFLEHGEARSLYHTRRKKEGRTRTIRSVGFSKGVLGTLCAYLDFFRLRCRK